MYDQYDWFWREKKTLSKLKSHIKRRNGIQADMKALESDQNLIGKDFRRILAKNLKD